MIWTILNLLCLVLVSVYLAVCLIKQRGIKWGAILLLPVLASGVLFFFHFTTWSILLLVGVGFAMLHLGNQKVSWIFLCLFYLVSNLLFLLFHLDRHQIADEKQSSIPRLFYRTPNYAYEKNNLLVAS